MGGGRRALEFRIGEPTADHPHVFAALVDWTHRDLRGRPGSSSRSGRTASIGSGCRCATRTRLRPTRAPSGGSPPCARPRSGSGSSLPFARLRSINPKTDGRLDLDKVRALVFVLDRGAVKPGTRGTIWLDDLGVY